MGDPALAAEEIAQRQQMLNAGTQTGPMPRRPQPGTGYQSGANVMADQLDELKQELAKISKQVAKPVADQSSVPQKEIERIARAISELKSQSEPSIEYFDRLTEELSNLRNFMKNDVQSAIRKGMQSKAGAQAQDLAKRIDALSADMKATIRTEVQGKDGAVMTELNQRLGTLNQVVDELKTHFQELVFDTVIHRNTTLSEASSHGATIIMHDAACKGSINYLNFAREILQKNNLTKIENDDKFIEIDHEL